MADNNNDYLPPDRKARRDALVDRVDELTGEKQRRVDAYLRRKAEQRAKQQPPPRETRTLKPLEPTPRPTKPKVVPDFQIPDYPERDALVASVNAGTPGSLDALRDADVRWEQEQQQAAALIAAGFDPRQPRGKGGEWIETGAERIRPPQRVSDAEGGGGVRRPPSTHDDPRGPYDSKGRPHPGTQEWIAGHGMAEKDFTGRPYDRIEPDNLSAIDRAYANDPNTRAFYSDVFSDPAKNPTRGGGFTMARYPDPDSPFGPLVAEVRPDAEVLTQPHKKVGEKKLVEWHDANVKRIAKYDDAQTKQHLNDNLKKANADLALVRKSGVSESQKRGISVEELRKQNYVDPAQAKVDAAQTLKDAALRRGKALRDNEFNAKVAAAEKKEGRKLTTDEKKSIRAGLKNPEGSKTKEHIEAKAALDAAVSARDTAQWRVNNWDQAQEEFFAVKAQKAAKNAHDAALADPAAAKAKLLKGAKEDLADAQERFADPGAKYVFPPGAGAAARVDIGNDATNRKNFIEGEGRVYVMMEGRIKADAVMNQIRKEDPTASVISIPSITLWHALDTKKLKGEIAKEKNPTEKAKLERLLKATEDHGSEMQWIAKNRLKNREVVLLPDADGPANRDVQRETKSLKAFIEQHTNGSAKVVSAAPPAPRDKDGNFIFVKDKNGKTKVKLYEGQFPESAGGAKEELKAADDYFGLGGRSNLPKGEKPSLGNFETISEPQVPKITIPTTMVKDKRVRNNATAVLSAVSTLVGHEGEGLVTVKDISRVSGVPYSTAQRILTERLTGINGGLVKLEPIYDHATLGKGRRRVVMDEDRIRELRKAGKIGPVDRRPFTKVQHEPEEGYYITIDRNKFEDLTGGKWITAGPSQKLSEWKPAKTTRPTARREKAPVRTARQQNRRTAAEQRLLVGTKYTKSQYNKVRALRRQGLTYEQIAEQTGIPKSTVQDIVITASAAPEVKMMLNDYPQGGNNECA